MNSTRNQAISVHNEVTVNHFDLGRLFGEWGNEEQSEFLHGMLVGLQDLGTLYQGIQLQLIAEAAELSGLREDLRELADIFNYYFGSNIEK